MKSRERSANRQSVASRSISGWNCCLLPNGELSDLLVEIKVPRENTRGAGLTDAYLCQLQLTMACTGTRRADCVVLREQGATRQLAVTRVERDDALLDVMEPQLLDFYAEAKEDDEPFPIDSVSKPHSCARRCETRAPSAWERSVCTGV